MRKRFSKKSDSNAKLRSARKQKGELAHGCYILDTEIFFSIGKALLCVNNVAVRWTCRNTFEFFFLKAQQPTKVNVFYLSLGNQSKAKITL